VDERGESREVSVRDLADLQGVPQEYLAKVFTQLAKMEEALDQQTILDLGRRVGRKAAAEFGGQVTGWLSERKEQRTSPAGEIQTISAVQVQD